MEYEVAQVLIYNARIVGNPVCASESVFLVELWRGHHVSETD
jgi:hypothetical protein